MHRANFAQQAARAWGGGSSVQGLVEFLRRLGAARLGAMAAVTVTLVGVFGFLILRVTSPQMTPLFTDLTVEDSTAIVKDLERQGVAYELKNDGAIVMVARDQVARVRMRLAEGGLPKGGGIGYEIFDKSDALGATSFVQNINHLRAMEGELARTIRSLDRVQAARVNQQVRAIRHLVASAVNGLKPERVSIVDEAGRLLADGASGESDEPGGHAEERQAAYERRLRQEVESIVSSVVGPGRARVQLTAEFDFNKITQTSDQFDPEGRVLRSSQTREEQSTTSESRDGQVTVGNELPGAAARPPAPAPEGQPPVPRDQSKKSEEIANYEISRTTKTEVIEGARVKRVSVAVLVDGTYAKGENGEVAYQPRGAEEIQRIGALVRSAIGFDQKRGDQVEVVNLRFAEAPVTPISEPTGWSSYLQFTKDDILRAIEWAVMGLLGLIVVLVVVRPLVRRILAPDEQAPQLAAPALVPAAAGNAPALAEGVPTITNHTSKMIDIAQVQGQVHAQSIQKVGDLAQKNPHEAVAIIRQWLHESPL
jgi:flagellar M-ring protein FliF